MYCHRYTKQNTWLPFRSFNKNLPSTFFMNTPGSVVLGLHSEGKKSRFLSSPNLLALYYPILLSFPSSVKHLERGSLQLLPPILQTLINLPRSSFQPQTDESAFTH